MRLVARGSLFNLQVVFVGAINVGKSSLVARYVKNEVCPSPWPGTLWLGSSLRM